VSSSAPLGSGGPPSVPAAGDAADAPRALDPKERLLDAAERLFAERGFEGTSMRALTQAAGLSVSAANYHFGSKDELLRATLLRRVDPVNRRRLAQLDALEAAAAPPSLESLITCFLGPAVEQFEAMRQRGERSFARHVLARLYTDPPELVNRLKSELFGEVNDRFAAALARALPGVAGERIPFLLQLATGTMVHVIGGQVDEQLLDAALPPAEAPAPGEADAPPLLAELVSWVCAGLRANSGRPAR
jgi:AcrR family transcriptional regulator